MVVNSEDNCYAMTTEQIGEYVVKELKKVKVSLSAHELLRDLTIRNVVLGSLEKDMLSEQKGALGHVDTNTFKEVFLSETSLGNYVLTIDPQGWETEEILMLHDMPIHKSDSVEALVESTKEVQEQVWLSDHTKDIHQIIESRFSPMKEFHQATGERLVEESTSIRSEKVMAVNAEAVLEEVELLIEEPQQLANECPLEQIVGYDIVGKKAAFPEGYSCNPEPEPMPIEEEFKEFSHLSNSTFPLFVVELSTENLQTLCINGEIANVVHIDMQENLNDVRERNVVAIIDELDHTVVGENLFKDQSVMPSDEYPVEKFVVQDNTFVHWSLIPHDEMKIGEKFHVYTSEFFQSNFHPKLFIEDSNFVLHVLKARGIRHHQLRPLDDIDISFL